MKLKDIATIQIGYQSPGKVEPDSKGTHRIIQIKDINEENSINPKELFWIHPKRETARYIVNKDDVLFLSRGHRNFATAITISLENTIAAGCFFYIEIRCFKNTP